MLIDTTTTSAFVTPDGMFQFGYSKDHRSDLPQLKIPLSALDPLGLPLTTAVVAGNCANDPLYVPEIRKVRQSIKLKGLTYIGDCKIAGLKTRAEIVSKDDYYLCPLSALQMLAAELDQSLEPIFYAGQPGRQTDRPTMEMTLRAFRCVTLSRVRIRSAPPWRLSPLSETQKRILKLLISFIAISSTSLKAQSGQPAKQNKPNRLKSVEAEIRALLDAQVTAWNAGKLEEFMDGYWRSPNLTFFSGGRKLSGWDATIERYRKTYQAEGREMGKLAFSDLDIQPLGQSAAVVRGRFELTMSGGKKLGGLYTLIFRRFKQGWKIVHDHTSSNQ